MGPPLPAEQGRAWQQRASSPIPPPSHTLQENAALHVTLSEILSYIIAVLWISLQGLMTVFDMKTIYRRISSSSLTVGHRVRLKRAFAGYRLAVSASVSAQSVTRLSREKITDKFKINLDELIAGPSGSAFGATIPERRIHIDQYVVANAVIDRLTAVDNTIVLICTACVAVVGFSCILTVFLRSPQTLLSDPSAPIPLQFIDDGTSLYRICIYIAIACAWHRGGGDDVGSASPLGCAPRSPHHPTHPPFP